MRKKNKFSFLYSCSIAFIFTGACGGCGPGVRDYTAEIAGGFSISDAGHYEKMIIKSGDDGMSEIIIDAMILDYKLDGDSILVIRQPRDVFFQGDIAHNRLLDYCEYWHISLKTGEPSKVKELRCSEGISLLKQ